MNPDITIVIPTYNVSQYIEKCLLSVLNQDFQGWIEVLVIDDCGQDDSINKVESIIQRHKRGGLVRIIHHEKNKGLGPSRNTGIDAAKGDYIFFLDSDDWISNNCLSTLFKKIKETNADFVVGSVLRVEGGSEKVYAKNIYPATLVSHSGAGVYSLYHAPDFHIEVWNKLYNTSFLKRNKIRFVHRIFEDYYFDFRLRASSSKIAFVSEVTLFYNIRPNSILTSLKSTKGTDESVKTFCEIINYLQRMLREEYSDVEGIYDLYFQRMIWVFENFKRYKYSPEQWDYIKAHIDGFCSFIDNENLLKIKRHRLIYKNTIKDETIENFYSAKSVVDKVPIWQKLIFYSKVIARKLIRR